MNFPQNLKYTNEHEWIRVEGDIAYVGITDYAQEQLGDIVFVDIPTVGETLEAGEVFGTIEVVKTISDLFLPVAGEVIELNEALEENLEKKKVLKLKEEDREMKVRIFPNPQRILSTKAKTDSRSIQERPCFLCGKNRPA